MSAFVEIAKKEKEKREMAEDSLRGLRIEGRLIWEEAEGKGRGEL